MHQPDGERPFFEKEIPSSCEAIGRLLDQALAAMAQHGVIDVRHAFHPRLCLEEALVNAVIHGNGDRPDRTVRLSIEATPQRGWVARVWDEGPGFIFGSPEPPRRSALGGRGLCLIKHCVDEAFYDAENRCLVMRKNRGGGVCGPKTPCGSPGPNPGEEHHA